MTSLTAACTILFLSFTGVFAEDRGHGTSVTPYGDFSGKCGKYGTCETPMKPGEAERAIRDYYNKKGLNVEIENARDRFIKAKVKDKDKTVDEIIFDSNTGRVRSIY